MGSTLRIVHSAGFCFDSTDWEGPAEWTVQRNADLWQTFDAMLSLCRSEEVDILLLAGNLFDQEYVRKETVERVARSFAGLQQTRIFMAPGEMDPLVNASAYRMVVWPENVHIFFGSMSQVEVSNLNAVVHGAGWTTYRHEKSFLDGFESIKDSKFHLMLLNAWIDTSQRDKKIAPIRLEQLEASGLTYLALGHQKTGSGLQREGKTFWADCGFPEARGFSDSGTHGVLLLEIEEQTVRFEFRGLGQRNYRERIISVEQVRTPETLVEILLKELSAEERQKDLFRFKLAGPRQKAEDWLLKMRPLLEKQFRFVEVLTYAEENDDENHKNENEEVLGEMRYRRFPTLAQVFTNNINKRINTSDNELNEHWKLVQKIGLAALKQGRVDNED